jgi:3-hydroxymyristoyl/3-hydroxydecanoyl-(acyl carrier protein) dehydratase
MNAPHAFVLPIAADHPAFAGHFPGHPIVPGVVLLDEAVRALAAQAGCEPTAVDLGVAKFLRPVKPGETVWLVCKPGAGARQVLEWRVGADPVQGELAATASLAITTPQAGG